MQTEFKKKRFCAVGRREGSSLAVAHLQVRLWAILTAVKKCQLSIISEDPETHNLLEDPPQLQACSLQDPTDPTPPWPSPNRAEPRSSPQEASLHWGKGWRMSRPPMEERREAPRAPAFIPGPPPHMDIPCLGPAHPSMTGVPGKAHTEGTHSWGLSPAVQSWPEPMARVLHTQVPRVRGNGGFLPPMNSSQAPEAPAACPKSHRSSDTV